MAKVYKVQGQWRVRFDDGSGQKREYVIPVRSQREAQRLAHRAERKVKAMARRPTSATPAPANGLCFEVLVNGRKARTVGMRGYGRINVFLEYARDNPDRWRGSTRRRFDVPPLLHLNALDRTAPEFDLGLSWPALKLWEGDEVTVRLVRDREPDRPSRSHKMRPLLLLA